MAIRDTLDDVLIGIGETTLTDSEYINANAILDGSTTNTKCYQALYSVLVSRSGEGDSIDKLKAKYRALGVDVSNLTNWSNILIGAVLED